MWFFVDADVCWWPVELQQTVGVLTVLVLADSIALLVFRALGKLSQATFAACTPLFDFLVFFKNYFSTQTFRYLYNPFTQIHRRGLYDIEKHVCPLLL